MNESENSVILIGDLGFGDAGKGSITDYLAREYPVHTVVRYNGGAQASHSVFTPDGKHHKFAQFGSASFVPGTKTHLSRFMFVDPLSMLKEERHLKEVGVTDIFERTSVDRDAVVITPFHQAVNRLKELARGKDRHGTVGMGVSETAYDLENFPGGSLTFGDLLKRDVVRKKLRVLREIQLNKLSDFKENLISLEGALPDLFTLEQPRMQSYIIDCAELYFYAASLIKIVDRDYMKKILHNPGVTVFEGAQGVLLDQKFGFLPYITKSNTTFENADKLLSEQDYKENIKRLGLVRVFPTRHGPGPFVTEDPELTQKFPDPENLENQWQGKFRVGFFDLLATGYALEIINGVDGLVISCLDQLEDYPKKLVCESYKLNDNQITKIEYQEGISKLLKECMPVYKDYSHLNPREYAFSIASDLSTPLSILSFGPDAKSKVRI